MDVSVQIMGKDPSSTSRGVVRRWYQWRLTGPASGTETPGVKPALG